MSRDGARIPLPWQTSAAGAHGFSPSGGGLPWLPVPEGWGRYSIQAQEESSGSDLRLFREATALRSALTDEGVFGPGDGVRWSVDGDSRLIAERDSGVRIVVAMGQAAVPLPPGTVLLSSEPLVDGMLPASAAAWVR